MHHDDYGDFIMPLQVDMNEINQIATQPNFPYVIRVDLQGSAEDSANRLLDEIC